MRHKLHEEKQVKSEGLQGICRGGRVEVHRVAPEADPCRAQPREVDVPVGIPGLGPARLAVHALSDSRVASSPNLGRKAQVMLGLQRTHGNAYVQRFVAGHAHGGTGIMRQAEGAPPASSAVAEAPPGASLAAPAPEAEKRYNLTIGSDVLENVTRQQAIRVLQRHYHRIRGWTEAEEGGHKRLKGIREEHWIVGAISDNLGGVTMPPLEMWALPYSLLEAAKADLDAGEVERSVQSLTRAEEAYVACHRLYYQYREGTISGAETAVIALKAVAVAGAVAATVATGGLAAGGAAPTLGIAAGTFKLGLVGVSTTVGVAAGGYGMTQELAGQVGEKAVGTRGEFDLLAILRRGAVDAVTGLVGALTGGALSNVLKRAFGSYLANVGDDVLKELGQQMGLGGPMPRDFFLTSSQRFLADFLGGAGAAPLTTAVAAIVNKVTGGEKPPKTPGEFVDRVVEEMVRGGIVQIFLGAFVHYYGGTGGAKRGGSTGAAQESTTTLREPPLEYAPTLEAPAMGGGRAPSAEPGPAALSTTKPIPPELAPTEGKPLSTTKPIPTELAPTERPLSEQATGEWIGPQGPVATGARPPARVLEPARYDVAPTTEGANSGKLRLRDRMSGEEFIFKPASGEVPIIGEEAGIAAGERYRRAPAAAQVAREAGISTPEAEVVSFQGQRGSLQRWVSQGKTLAQIARENPPMYQDIWNSQLKKDIDTFDYLIANMDRNQGNLMVVFAGLQKIHLLDS